MRRTVWNMSQTEGYNTFWNIHVTFAITKFEYLIISYDYKDCLNIS